MKSRFKHGKVTVWMMTAALTLGLAGPAMAADTATATFDPPTEPMAVEQVDGKDVVTATAHRAASPLPDMLGMNTTSGFGMIQGKAPTSLKDARSKAALGIWGTSLNDNPDPYYWNYFYNFYASENGKATVQNALRNTNVAASPTQADTNLVEEYGNVSVSLSTRPEVVIGCSAQKATDSTDTGGYADQLNTIHGFTRDSSYYRAGDETYNPKLVSYQVTTLNDMVKTVDRTADAMKEVMDEKKETGRYGDPTKIADAYETYVNGIQNYIAGSIAKGSIQKKTVAIVQNLDKNTGEFTLYGAGSRSATSSVRAIEYTAKTTENLTDRLHLPSGTGSVSGDAGSQSSDSKVYLASAAQVKQADAVIVMDNGEKDFTEDDIREALGTDYKGLVIATAPEALYGVTMNSVENAMGMAYLNAYLYHEELGLNPVDFCAYYYEKFYHVTDRDKLNTLIKTNFAGVTLPEGVTAEVSDSYSPENIEKILNSDGKEKTAGKKTQKITIVKKTLKKSFTQKALKKSKKTFAVKASAKGAVSFAGKSGNKNLSISRNGKVTVKKGLKKGTYRMNITVSAGATAAYKAAKPQKAKVIVTVK